MAVGNGFRLRYVELQRYKMSEFMYRGVEHEPRGEKSELNILNFDLAGYSNLWPQN